MPSLSISPSAIPSPASITEQISSEQRGNPANSARLEPPEQGVNVQRVTPWACRRVLRVWTPDYHNARAARRGVSGQLRNFAVSEGVRTYPMTRLMLGVLIDTIVISRTGAGARNNMQTPLFVTPLSSVPICGEGRWHFSTSLFPEPLSLTSKRHAFCRSTCLMQGCVSLCLCREQPCLPIMVDLLSSRPRQAGSSHDEFMMQANLQATRFKWLHPDEARADMQVPVSGAGRRTAGDHLVPTT